MLVAHKMGLFTIYDPPNYTEGHPDISSDDWVEVIVDAYKTTEYPWERIIPGMQREGFSEIRVEFSSDLSQNTLAVYESSLGRIVIGTQYGLSGVPFSMVHEMGHMVDHLTFSWEIQQEIMAYWHTMKCRYHYPDISPMHGWAHEQPHPENWVAFGNVPYLFRHNEAFADAFVAAFNPTWWGARGPWGRFIHWPSDHISNPPIPHYDKIRELTLKEPIMAFSDVSESHPHYEGIMWAAANGLVAGYSDGTFKPDLRVTDANGVPRTDVKISGIVTRAALCTVLKRYHDAAEAGTIV